MKIDKNIGLAVDIDETLSNTVSYYVEQLQKKFGNPENLSVEEIVKKYKFAQNVPYWQTEEALGLIDKMRQDDTIQEHLYLIENSNKTLQEINKIIPIVVYLTARPEKISNGTEKFLKKHNFPEAKVIYRPESIPHQEGVTWKARTLEELYPGVIGIIDDNLNFIKKISDEYKGVIFLYNKEYNEERNLNVIPCKTWQDVLENVKKEVEVSKEKNKSFKIR